MDAWKFNLNAIINTQPFKDAYTQEPVQQDRK